MTGGGFATEHQVEFIPSLETPGEALLLGGGVKGNAMATSMEEAERVKINHDRRASGLEKIEEMPPTWHPEQFLCRRCRSIAKYRCRACWTTYCSASCKRKHWASHVFRCSVRHRPNDVDFLRLVIRRVVKEVDSGDGERCDSAIRYLLADDNLCRTFGFSSCRSTQEVLNLVCIYNSILSGVRPVVMALQSQLEAGTLGDLIRLHCQLEAYATSAMHKECSCVHWFLKRQSSDPMLIPNREGLIYGIWTVAVFGASKCLDLTTRLESGYQFNNPQRDVFKLYVAIQPNAWLQPDIYSSSWIKFGFYSCESFQQRAELALKYLELASTGAQFDDIVAAYETSSLAGLMHSHNIDTSELEKQGIRFHRPPPYEARVFRLMVGVEHALSGRFCSCFRLYERRDCHWSFETHLDKEAATQFGFLLSTSWERWQLLNFYKHLFHLPGFDPSRMTEAAALPDLDRLESYLNTLVPDLRSKLYNRTRADISFPRLRDRLVLSREDGEEAASQCNFSCECKVHGVFGPPGISTRSIDAVIASMQGIAGEKSGSEVACL